MENQIQNNYSLVNMLYDYWKRYEVKGITLQQFVETYSSARHWKGTMQDAIKSRQESLDRFGYCMIVDPINSDSLVLTYYGNEQ